MRLRNLLATTLGALTMLAGVTLSDAANAGDEVTIGTLAPKKSEWGKVFNVWAKAVKKKSDGNLTIKWYYNAQQGDEKAMIAKIRSGQLDAAAVTGVGLGAVHKPFLALQMPGLCTDWGCLDKVRNGVIAELKAGAKKNGFIFLGAGDVGRAHTYAKGKAIRTPSDLKTMKVYQWIDDPMGPTIASEIGYTGTKTTVPGLLPKLSAGQINVATVPALACEQLQWASHFDHVTKQAAAVAIGGLVMSKAKLDSLPADSRALMIRTGKKAGDMLTKRIRKHDAKAYRRTAGRMTVVDLSPAEWATWRSVFKKVRRRLGQGTFSAAWVSKLVSLAVH